MHYKKAACTFKSIHIANLPLSIPFSPGPPRFIRKEGVHMILRKISIRLGMNLGLYIGTCIGVIVAGIIILLGYYLFSLTMIHLMGVTVSLILASVLVIGIIVLAQNHSFSRTDEVCTCRYRSSWYTYCRQCALYPKNRTKEDE